VESTLKVYPSMDLMEYMIINDEGKKIKERMRDVMDDGVCQN